MRVWKDVPYGYCHCGCGRKTTISKRTQHKMKHVAGQPFHFIAGHGTKESNESRFLRNFEKGEGDECWLWTGGTDKHGYGVMGNIKAHRFAYEHHYGPFDKKLGVLHRCDNPPCIRPDHLFLGTQIDNIKDMWAKGRGVPYNSPNGEENPNAVLTELEVREIKSLLASGMRQKDVIALYTHKVTKSCIAMIAQGRTWKHIK